MKKILLGSGVLFLLLCLAAVTIPFMIPSSFYREKIEKTAGQVLGRPVTIHGDISLSLLPPVSVKAQNVVIDNQKGFEAETLANMEELRASLKLLPLFSRRIEVREFSLIKPRLNLEQHENGRKNWIIIPSDHPAPSPKPDPAEQTQQSFRRQPGELPFDISLGKVTLVDGTAVYKNFTTEKEYTLTKINLDLSMVAFDQPLSLGGSFYFNYEPLSFQIHLDTLKSFFEGQKTPLVLDFKSDLARAHFKGHFLQSESPDFSGDLNLTIPSLHAIAATLGTTLPDGQVYKNFSITGIAAGGMGYINFEKARLTLDAIKGEGSLKVSFPPGERLNLGGMLNLQGLDLTPYMKKQPKQNQTNQGKNPTPSSTPSDAHQAGSDAPQTGWPVTEFNLLALQAFDTSFSLTTPFIKFKNITLGESVLKARLQKGVLNLDLEKLDLYEGSGHGAVYLNTHEEKPVFTMSLLLDKVRVFSLLKDAADFKKLEGQGKIQLDIKGQGKNLDSLMHTLSGEGNFTFTDGALVGVNLGALARSFETLLENGHVESFLKQGVHGLADGSLAKNFGTKEKTDFTELRGTFSLKEGIAYNDDLVLLAPLIRVKGHGFVDVGGQSLDYRLNPGLVASSQGQGGETDIQGVAPVDIIFKGPWQSVTTSFGIDALEKTAERAARKALQKEGTKLIDKQIGGEAGDLLKDLLGLKKEDKKKKEDQSKDQSDQKKEGKKKKLEETLKGLFGN